MNRIHTPITTNALDDIAKDEQREERETNGTRGFRIWCPFGSTVLFLTQ